MAASVRKERLLRQREQELLDAAAELYREGDWRAVPVERIAARAGIGKGTVYLHFRHKEEVAARLALRFLKRLAGSWRQIAPEAEPLARARALLETARRLSEAHPGQLVLVQGLLEPALRERLSAPVRADLLGALRTALRVLDAGLAGRAAEDLPAPGSWEIRAWFAWSVLLAALLVPPELGEPPLTLEASMAAAADTLVSALQT
jgi:AcrR family transcriptional regulator